jgi:hypothetical protein
MTVRFPSPFRGWRAAFLLVAAACASPGRASAECGDHVIILNGPAAANAKATPTPANPIPTPDTQPAAPRPPCHGPNCSGSPAPKAPLAPITAPTSQFKEQAGQVVGDCDEGGDQGARFGRDSDSPRPIRRPSSVFHPPRLG